MNLLCYFCRRQSPAFLSFFLRLQGCSFNSKGHRDLLQAEQKLSSKAKINSSRSPSPTVGDFIIHWFLSALCLSWDALKQFDRNQSQSEHNKWVCCKPVLQNLCRGGEKVQKLPPCTQWVSVVGRRTAMPHRFIFRWFIESYNSLSWKGL